MAVSTYITRLVVLCNADNGHSLYFLHGVDSGGRKKKEKSQGLILKKEKRKKKLEKWALFQKERGGGSLCDPFTLTPFLGSYLLG